MFDELLKKWAKAFDEVHLLDEFQQKAVVMKYAYAVCFELEDYTPGNFPPRDELLNIIPGEVILGYEEYGLSADGLPCYHQRVYNDDKRYAGFYRYSPEAVEYIFFNLGIGVPYLFHRIEFEAGRKVSFQRVTADGGGGAFARMTGEQAIQRAKNDEYSIFLSERRYEYKDGRIVRDISDNRVPGMGQFQLE